MTKKCIPGVICIENMTLAVFAFLLIVVGYMYYVFIVKVRAVNHRDIRVDRYEERVLSVPMIGGIATRNTPNVILDPYGPPLKTDGTYFPSDSGDIRGIPMVRPIRAVPVNIETRGLSQDYTQMGILTREKDDLILTLMGRRLVSGLDKWQYYTISNTGNMNTKLPIKVRGRSCSGEYGCECLMSGDIVYVEGYQDTFKATIYENASFSYIPYI
jgi:Family of unknown function (DUF5755)